MPDVRHLPDAVFQCRDIRAFNRLFVRLPEIRLYAVLLALAASVAVWLADNLWQILLPVLGIVLAYPPFEYAMHRWLLHNHHLCRTPPTARVWWRLHYRHHAEPQDARVILGAPPSLIAAAGAAALLIASVFWSWAALAAAVSAAFAAAIAYEYFHSLGHSHVSLSNPYLRRMRKHHLAHHYVSEKCNYGIITEIVDRIVGTSISLKDLPGRSPTVHNLGYTESVAETYPWLAEFDRSQTGGNDRPSQKIDSAQ